MGLYDFSIKLTDKDAGAQVIDVNASYKDFSQVCRAIKHKPVAEAREILEQGIAKKKAIPYKKFAKHLGHKKELKGRRGRYPVKEAKITLRLLNDAVANARQKALNVENLVVKHAAAYKQRVYPRYRRYWVGGTTIGYGKQAVWSRYVSCRAELVVSEAGKKEKQAVEKQVVEKAAAVEKVRKQVEKPRASLGTKALKAVEKPGESEKTEAKTKESEEAEAGAEAEAKEEKAVVEREVEKAEEEVRKQLDTPKYVE